MIKWIALIALIAGGWYIFHDVPAQWRGIPAARDPIQTDKTLPRPFNHGDYTIKPLANYAVTAVVLARKRYHSDASAKIGPVDLALGWGPMSTAVVINDLSISQSGRWYEYRWAKEPPLNGDQIERHSANTHCLPADNTVRSQLLAVKRHDLVTLEGFLVEVNGPDGYRWRSSLSRNDTGGGACEVMWITRVSRRDL